MRELTDYLEINRGITTVIGSGGKTSLMKRLSEELTGTVILTTSTHIVPYENMALYTGSDAEKLRTLLETERVICMGTPEGVKITTPELTFENTERVADYVIVEGDGSHRLPLKAHAEFEPVIPSNTNQVILVVGASGWDRKIEDAVHRPEIFRAKGTVFCFSEESEFYEEQIVTPENYADFIAYELGNKKIEIPDNSELKIFINQADDEILMGKARRFASEFRQSLSTYNFQSVPVIAGSLIKNKYELL